MEAEKQLLEAVEKLTTDFSIILELIEKYNLDTADILCDKYPFQLSFDEQYCTVLGWRDAMQEKVNK